MTDAHHAHTDEPGHDPQTFDWNAAYAGREVHPEPPDTEVMRVVSGLPPGRALDVGCGAGGLVLELARLGFDVTGIDIAAGAIAAAERALSEQGLSATLHVADATVFDPGGAYDLVTDCFALPGTAEGQARVFDMMRRAVAPGGHVLMVDFDPGMKRTASAFANWHMLDVGEVSRAFAGFEILRAEVAPTPVHDHDGSGAHAGERWTATHFHARRPE